MLSGKQNSLFPDGPVTKVAPYSLTIARALSTKAQVICPRSKENVSAFGYFMTSTWAQKAKLTVNFLAFPSVKFRKICRLVVNIYFSCNSFFREIYLTSFSAAVIGISLQKPKKLPVQTLVLTSLKFYAVQFDVLSKFSKISPKEIQEHHK